jgi:hypothetical protein
MVESEGHVGAAGVLAGAEVQPWRCASAWLAAFQTTSLGKPRRAAPDSLRLGVGRPWWHERDALIRSSRRAQRRQDSADSGVRRETTTGRDRATRPDSWIR